ncbi:hypothetical protein AN634_10095 [Lactiplantibacillus plantarum]|uniref:hypothetical protein n=1 Tax=Lactiplantibacillus plantarum TaxID=1590 RepID=UPI0006D49C68|nr:hypothetical protein [Lactiplantibacillus plantarum]ALG26346.1 hypothetical protein AN634_10095 [Lactiplantibacillus plantarum]
MKNDVVTSIFYNWQLLFLSLPACLVKLPRNSGVEGVGTVVWLVNKLGALWTDFLWRAAEACACYANESMQKSH